MIAAKPVRPNSRQKNHPPQVAKPSSSARFISPVVSMCLVVELFTHSLATLGPHSTRPGASKIADFAMSRGRSIKPVAPVVIHADRAPGDVC